MPAKKAPDINEIHRTQGRDAVRKLFDEAEVFGRAKSPEQERPRANGPFDDELGADDTSFGEIPTDPPKSKEPPKGEQTKKTPLPHKFPLIKFDNIHVDTKRRNYLVKGLLASTGLTVIWGPPKCGKSFWTIDIALHIALGWKYRGRHVQQAPVVYIALEGQSGLDARVDAFKRHHSVDQAPFYLIKVRVDLIADHAALVADIKAQIGTVMPGAVFIDTLNRSLVGSESKDEDMGRYLAAAEYVGTKLGCAVIVVHHCGIDATRPRGHTSLTGTVESQLAVKRGETREVIVTVESAKDFEEGAEVYSRLERVPLGTDPDGDEITSLVVVPVETSARHSPTPRRKLSDRQQLGLAALTECLCNGAEPAPATWQLPAGIKVVSVDAWQEELYRRGTLKRAAKGRREEFKRLRESLQARELIGIRDDKVWKV